MCVCVCVERGVRSVYVEEGSVCVDHMCMLVHMACMCKA